MAKRILTKERLDKQLAGQTSTSPFMSFREGTNRKVSFDTRDKLGDKINKLTVMLVLCNVNLIRKCNGRVIL